MTALSQRFVSVAMGPVPPKVDVQVLPVYPPWAHLLVAGKKVTLQQCTQTLRRGWFAVYVPQSTPPWCESFRRAEPFLSALAGLAEDRLAARGVIVGLVHCRACHTRGREALWAQNQLYGDPRPGSWLWEFDRVRAFAAPVEYAAVGKKAIDPVTLDKVLCEAGSLT